MTTRVSNRLRRKFKFDEQPPVRGKPIVNHLLPQGLHLLVGPATAGKTTLSMQLADAVTKGEPFCGHPTRRGAVVLVLLERDRTMNAAKLHAVVPDYDPTRLIVWNEAVGRPGVDRGGRQRSFAPLRDFLREYERENGRKLRLLVIDSLSQLLPKARSGDMAPYLSTLRLLRTRLLPYVDAIVVIHHANKGGLGKLFLDDADVRDHTVLLQESDARWLLGREDGGNHRGLRVTGQVPQDVEMLFTWNDRGLAQEVEMTPRFRQIIATSTRLGVSFDALLDGLRDIQVYRREHKKPIPSDVLAECFGSSKQSPLIHSLYTALGFKKKRRWVGKDKNKQFIRAYQLKDPTLIDSLVEEGTVKNT